MNKLRTLAVGSSAAAVLISGAILAPAAHASGGGGGVTNSGNCSQSSTWKLKAKSDDGVLEVEFEVDSNVNGQKWNVRLADNGTAVAHGTATTAAPSGSFEFARRVPNQAGRDVITGVAKQAATGEVCKAKVVFTG